MRKGAVVMLAAVAALSACSGGASATPTATTPPPTAREVVARSGPVTISVLGDSTGNAVGEWVDLWARHLGQTRRIVEHTWSWKFDRWNDVPVRYGTTGPLVTIWNGSQTGADPDYALRRFARMQPAKPDLVIFNFGHNGTPEGTTSGLAQLQALTAGRWSTRVPSVVVLQNPGLTDHAAAQEKNLAAISAWAKATGTPTIDVTSAFRAAGPERLMIDHAHPNAAGSALWESVVQDALG